MVLSHLLGDMRCGLFWSGGWYWRSASAVEQVLGQLLTNEKSSQKLANIRLIIIHKLV